MILLLNHGDKLFIQSGPFSGYEAIFDININGSQRARVLIKMLSRGGEVTLELPINQDKFNNLN